MTELAFVNAHVVPIEGIPFEGTVRVRDGRIAALGAHLTVPPGATVVALTVTLGPRTVMVALVARTVDELFRKNRSS